MHSRPAEHLAGDHRPGVPEEVHEYLQLAGTERHGATLPRHPPLQQVDLDPAGSQDLLLDQGREELIERLFLDRRIGPVPARFLTPSAMGPPSAEGQLTTVQGESDSLW
jgi:hypothetical protein